MKSWLRNSLWLIFLIAVWIGLSFAGGRQDERTVGIPEVEISMYEDMMFLTEGELLQRLSDKHLIGEEMYYDEMQLQEIEQYVAGMSEVHSAEAFTYLSGKWCLKLKLRQPIARIFNQNGRSCYLDKEGKLMPLSPDYTAHVVTVDGYINETDFSKSVDDIINNDSLKTIEILDDLYEISNYVCSDDYLSAQITHIHINEHREFEMIPRVGDHRILFGKAEWIAGKFKKLGYFYSEGMSRAGWESYDTINVMYKNQVVCSKK